MFKLQNPETDFKAIKRLLSDSISSELKLFDIKKPFISNLKLTGKFAHGNNPIIEGKFSTSTNEIVILDKYHFKNAVFTGNLTNDIYISDSLKNEKKSSKGIKLFFKNLKADFDDVKVDIENSYYQSTPEAHNFIEAKVHLKGSNETMANLIEMENFDFSGGTFELYTSISGDIPNLY